MNQDQLTKTYLLQKQSLPLEAKIVYSQRRARDFVEFCEARGVEPVISFSAGKDSTVMADVLRDLFPWLKLVFVNTRLEFREIIRFAKQQSNIDIITPEKTFKEIVEKYGFPAVSKNVARAIEDLQSPGREKVKKLRLTGVTSDGRAAPSFKLAEKWKYLIDGPRLSARCCDYMKIQPIEKYQKKNKCLNFVGTMASDSQKREKAYLKNGCNSFLAKSPKAAPLSIWTEQDILLYIKTKGVKICSVYGDIIETESGLKTTGEDRTGCVKCGFGACAEQEKTGTNRFIRLYQRDPNLWAYCMADGGAEVFNYLGLPVTPDQKFNGWKPRGA